MLEHPDRHATVPAARSSGPALLGLRLPAAVREFDPPLAAPHPQAQLESGQAYGFDQMLFSDWPNYAQLTQVLRPLGQQEATEDRVTECSRHAEYSGHACLEKQGKKHR